MKRTKRGFTLVEVMVVVAIIAILAALAVPNFIAYRKTAHAKACMENMEIIRTACRTYQINHSGQYTTDLDRLSGSNGKGLMRPDIKCPVGGKYTVTYDEQTQSFEVTCDKADEDVHNVEK